MFEIFILVAYDVDQTSVLPWPIVIPEGVAVKLSIVGGSTVTVTLCVAVPHGFVAVSV